MQNELKTTTTGTVTIVHVQVGATVESGAALTVAAPNTYCESSEKKEWMKKSSGFQSDYR